MSDEIIQLNEDLIKHDLKDNLGQHIYLYLCIAIRIRIL
jgi:hypothetical protein